MYTIKTLNKISPVGLGVFDGAKYTVDDSCETPDAIVLRSAKIHDYVFNPELLCIARAGAGTNNIPCDRCADEGIVVFNTPGANAEAVKELVICALLLSSRKITDGIDWVKSIAGSEDVAALVEKGKGAYVGPEIKGKALGVIGLGAIGAKVANDATALGMKVYGYDPFLSVDAAWGLSSGVIHAKDVDTIYKNCDYVTIHVPYMPATKHTINADAISKMKDGVRVINLARAELVDDDAMLPALESGKVSCYVTDFPNNKTAGAKGVIAIPHLGASTPESEDNCAVMAAKSVMEYIETGNITNSVNMPAAHLPKTDDPRICVIHKNIPDMIAKISAAVSACGLNIENMLNAGKKDAANAYTIIDVPALTGGIEEKIGAIEGVIRVRTIK